MEKNWTVGQECVVKSYNSHCKATIVKVGRKYVTADVNGRHLEFDAETGNYRVSEYSSRYHLYTVEEYAHVVKVSALQALLQEVSGMSQRARNCTVEQLNELIATLERVKAELS